jgi:hypothetical protein
MFFILQRLICIDRIPSRFGCPRARNFCYPAKSNWKVSFMRSRTKVVLEVFVLLALVVAAWSKPLPWPALGPPAAEAHSVSGKIAAVGETQVALDILKDRKPGIIHFLIDEHTAIEGKLAVGAQAAVDYRVDGDKMIATHIIITQASGVRPAKGNTDFF